MNDRRLDSLLSQVPAPPAPAGLAARVAAIATGLPQEARPVLARRAVGRDRRGAWLRRPLIGGAIALGLAFSGAVAATLAGVPLPARVQAVMAQIPFVGHKAVSEPEHVPARHAAARPLAHPTPPQPRAADIAAAEQVPPGLQPGPAAMRRMMLAQRIVARREALGLPSRPGAQIERAIQRRQMVRRWERATPEQRQFFAATHPRAAAMIERRLARRGEGPEQRQAFFETHPQAEARQEEREAFRGIMRERREAYFATHPRARAMMEARRARREGQAIEPR